MTLSERLQWYADRVLDFDHPDGWLESWPIEIVNDVREAAQRIDLMREALEAVEWVVDGSGLTAEYCPWCGAESPHEDIRIHRSDCVRQNALGLS